MGTCASHIAAIETAGLQGALLADLARAPDHAELISAIKGRHLLLQHDTSGTTEQPSTSPQQSDLTHFDLNALPPDIIRHIRTFLPPRSSWALLQVPNIHLHSTLQSGTHHCRLLVTHTHTSHAAHRHFPFKHHHDAPSKHPPINLATCGRLLACCPTLHELDLTSYARHLTTDLLLTLLTSIPPQTLAHITTLKLGPDSQQIPSDDFPAILPYLPALRHLDSCLNSSCVLRAISMKNLLLAVPHLSTLTLHPASNFAMESSLDSALLQTILLCSPPHLQLDLHAWHASMLQLHLHSAAFENVTSLQLQWTGDFQANTRGVLPNLESVRLQCKGAVTFATLSHSFLATARKLKQLHIQGLEGTGATEWLGALEGLQELVLSHVKFPVYSISYWRAFLSNFPLLTTLVIDMCSGIPECCLYPSLPKTSHRSPSSPIPFTSIPAAPIPPPRPDDPNIPQLPTASTLQTHLHDPDSTPSPTRCLSHLRSCSLSSSTSSSPSHPSSPSSPPALPPCTHPHLQTLGFTTHWGTGAHPSYSAIHRWLLSLSRLRVSLPTSYALSSLYLHFNHTDAEADAALPHLRALAYLPNLSFLQITTTQVRCIDSKMIPSSHLPHLCSLAAVPRLKTLRLLYGWLSPPSLSLLLSSLSHLHHLSFISSPDISSTRRYLSVIESLPPSLHLGFTFVASLKDVTHNMAALGKVLESRRVREVRVVLLESKALQKVVAMVRRNPAVEDVEIVLPRCENEAEVRETVAAQLESEGVRVKVGFHAGCFKAWAKALGDPGIVQNAEQGDWRQLVL